MSRRNVGLIALLAGSLVLGAVLGMINYRLFLSNVPDTYLSAMGRAMAPAQFVGVGLLIGLVMFVWSLLAVVLSRGFRARPDGRATADANRG
ncbi:MAG: hypothetical protein ACYDIE_14400 [Candidatus Krumholzibacteriia bacterium]